MISVLSIANSFGQDAQRYLHGVAKADGQDMTCVNLYIGGCSLWQHFRNLKANASEYSMEFNGESTGFFTDIKTALLSRRWDYVTLQQASHESTRFENYGPYILPLAEAVREYAPEAKLAIHQTWAYAQGYERLHGALGYTDWQEMYRDVEAAYAQAAGLVKAELVIPAGKTMRGLVEAGVPAHRDGFHASLGIGRFALALTWYHALTGRDIADNRFCSFDVPVSEEEIAIAKRAAAGAFSRE